eukprot:CAMPEP_0119314052 /NCGR_PEP_ID=MMETSP1333-20130426/31457_1 /TAXON_ID=418940 /ORGANISM="Scyphosphaera apsteinii, Strain RCC1455" /LENGTH=191 /DNA_ID=CAMNT_0007319075 /DNA_START=63 /DNA_END=638 /DNA_ORIENTATION=+
MSIGRLKPESCIVLICDIQERFRNVIHKFEAVQVGASRISQTAQLLEIPVIVTEQYPKGLGHTVAELEVSHAKVFEKTCFSMLSPDVQANLVELNFTDVIIAGLEAHVCVQQTTLDLLEKGYNVHLCADAISSQTLIDRTCGLRRAERAGAFISTTESIMMELIRSKDHPHFKAISTLLKEKRPTEALESV